MDVLDTSSGLLGADAAMSAASAASGLGDFGDPGFQDGLSRLLQSVQTESELSEFGRVSLQMDVERLLVNRLRIQRDLAAHPEIVDQDVSDPVVVVGMPRTGTTKLHRMLAADPGTQKLPLWRVLNPAPLPETTSNGPDPRLAVAEGFEDLLTAQFPDLAAAHPMRVQEPEEEVLLMQLTFETELNGFYYRTPSYLAWLDGRPQLPVYRYLRDVLRYLQWQDGGARERPWILKSPIHLGSLDSLFEVFPDATVIHCHRHPRTATASLCRLIEVVRASRGLVDFDRNELGSMLLASFSRAWQRNIRFRDQHPATVLDVSYSEISDDPMGVIAAAHRAGGRELTPDAEHAMRAWAADNPPDPDGRHRYSLERYGLSPEQVDEAFHEYLDRFEHVLAR